MKGLAFRRKLAYRTYPSRCPTEANDKTARSFNRFRRFIKT